MLATTTATAVAAPVSPRATFRTAQPLPADLPAAAVTRPLADPPAVWANRYVARWRYDGLPGTGALWSVAHDTRFAGTDLLAAVAAARDLAAAAVPSAGGFPVQAVSQSKSGAFFITPIGAQNDEPTSLQTFTLHDALDGHVASFHGTDRSSVVALVDATSWVQFPKA